MTEDFRAKITAELDTAAAENKLEAFLNKKNKLKIDVEVNQIPQRNSAAVLREVSGRQSLIPLLLQNSWQVLSISQIRMC